MRPTRILTLCLMAAGVIGVIGATAPKGAFAASPAPLEEGPRPVSM